MPILVTDSGAAILANRKCIEVNPSGTLDDGFYVTIAGVPYPEHVQRGVKIIRRAGVASTASCKLIAAEDELDRVPTEGDEIEIRAGSATAPLLFAGFLDEPEITLIPGDVGLYEASLNAVGFRRRLDDRVIPQTEAIHTVGLSSGRAQVETLLSLVVGEGFTSRLVMPDDLPDRADMRFEKIGVVLDRIAERNDAVVVVTPEKVVTIVSRGSVTDDVRLNGTNTGAIKVDFDRQNYRTEQVIRGGELSRTTRFEAVRGLYPAFRIGGAVPVTPRQSLFTAPVGENGVLWRDERSRSGTQDDGTRRGSRTLAVLLSSEYETVRVPADLVMGTDPDNPDLPESAFIELSISDTGVKVDGPNWTSESIPKLAMLFRAPRGAEYVWPFTALRIAIEPDRPGKPVGVARVDGGIDWTWAAADERGGTITAYTLDFTDEGAIAGPSRDERIVVSTTGATTAFYDFTRRGRRYTARVRATNFQGDSVWSEYSNIVRGLASVPDAPTPPSGVAAQQAITWSFPAPAAAFNLDDLPAGTPSDNGDNITDMELAVRIEGPTDGEVQVLTPEQVAARSFLDERLSPLSFYQARSRARNSVGWGPWSAWGTSLRPNVGPVTQPGKPFAFPVGGITQTSILWTWGSPDSSGGQFILNYDIEVRLAPDGVAVDQMYGGSDLTYYDTGLMANTGYQARVRASNRMFTSAWSDWSDTETTLAEPTVPEKPNAPTVTHFSEILRSIDWSWDFYFGATDFDLQVRTVTTRLVDGEVELVPGPTVDQVLSADDIRFRRFRDTGLTANAIYQARVRVSNAVGPSPWSDWSSIVRLSGTGPAPDPSGDGG